MADQTVVHIGENSPEQVAYRLMHEIATVEGVSFSRMPSQGNRKATREWILKTYVQCQFATRGYPPSENDGDPADWLKG